MFKNTSFLRKMRILKLIKDYEGFIGKTIFEKLVYFLSFLGINHIEYIFEKWHYGPFSQGLESDLENLFEENLIKIEKRNNKLIIIPNKEEIEKTFEENKIKFESNQLQDIAESNIMKLFEYDLKSLKFIELAATMHYLIQTEYNPLKIHIFEALDCWKPNKFSIDEKKYVWDVLNSYKLINHKILIVNSLIDELNNIKAGKNDAYKYQRVIKKIIKFLFDNQLDSIKIEDKVNFGRKRLDISAYNISEKGFFNELHKVHKIKCPYIIFECKNHSFDLKNSEFNQIGFQLSDDIGYFGILVCRKVDNNERILKDLKDLLNNTPKNKKYIIILQDADVKEMLILKVNNADPDSILRKKLKELLFNQPNA